MKTNMNRCNALWTVVLAGVFWCVVGGLPVPGLAQKPPAVASAPSPVESDITTLDAQRGAVDRFLDAHPDIEEMVVNNPAAIRSPKYLQRHPELEAFLDSHPQVKADPRAFLPPGVEPPRSGEDRLMNILVLICILLAFLWVVRTFVESRRWNRSSKMQEDLHAKLIEKFASSQDFSAYMQSDAGRRLIEWTPPVLDAPSRGLPNPLGRIFWSVQAGLVLLLVGLGLLLIRGQMAESSAPPLLVFGTLGVTLGAGFILAAVVSYSLSKRLGLIAGAVPGSDATRKS